MHRHSHGGRRKAKFGSGCLLVTVTGATDQPGPEHFKHSRFPLGSEFRLKRSERSVEERQRPLSIEQNVRREGSIIGNGKTSRTV